MAKIIEPERQQDNQDEQQLDMFSQVEEQQETPEVQEPEIPDKYKGKSAEELVQMHQEAEKLLGRQSSEACFGMASYCMVSFHESSSVPSFHF